MSPMFTFKLNLSYFILYYCPGGSLDVTRTGVGITHLVGRKSVQRCSVMYSDSTATKLKVHLLYPAARLDLPSVIYVGRVCPCPSSSRVRFVGHNPIAGRNLPFHPTSVKRSSTPPLMFLCRPDPTVAPIHRLLLSTVSDAA